VATTLLAREPKVYSGELLQLAKKAERNLTGEEHYKSDELKLKPAETPNASDDVLMKEQLQFIYSVSKDMNKLAKTID
jgi:hypothetical protein